MAKTVLLSLLIIFTVNAVNAQKLPSLKGIVKVNVWIDFLKTGGTGPCADISFGKSFNLAEDDVRADTELQLRKAGLVVVTGEAPARLHVAVTGCLMETPTFILSTMNVYLTLEEPGTTDRGKRGEIVSWYGLAGAVNPHDPRATIQEYVGRFVNQWLADK